MSIFVRVSVRYLLRWAVAGMAFGFATGFGVMAGLWAGYEREPDALSTMAVVVWVHALVALGWFARPLLQRWREHLENGGGLS